MQAKYEETSLSKNSFEDVKYQCLSQIPDNAYVTRFEKSHHPHTQHQDTLFTIKR